MKFKYRAYVQVINDEFYEGTKGTVIKYDPKFNRQDFSGITDFAYLVELNPGEQIWFKEENLTNGSYFVSPPPDGFVELKV